MAVSSPHQTFMDVLIEKLAYVRGIPEDDVRTEVVDHGGDLEIDSKMGQAVAVLVEIALDMEGAIRPEDQNPQNLTSLRSLEELVRYRHAEQTGATNG